MKFGRTLTLCCLLLAFFAQACGSAAENAETAVTVSATGAPATLTEVPLGAGYGVRAAWFELYFTNPLSPLASQKTGGPDGPVVQALDAARLSIDAAMYSLSLNSIRAALIRAQGRREDRRAQCPAYHQRTHRCGSGLRPGQEKRRKNRRIRPWRRYL